MNNKSTEGKFCNGWGFPPGNAEIYGIGNYSSSVNVFHEDGHFPASRQDVISPTARSDSVCAGGSGFELCFYAEFSALLEFFWWR